MTSVVKSEGTGKINKEFSDIVSVAMSEADIKNKDVCEAFKLDEANGSKKIRDGSLIAKTKNLFKLWELTKSPSLQAFIAAKFELSVTPGVKAVLAKPKDLLPTDKQKLVAENEKLAKEKESLKAQLKKLAKEINNISLEQQKKIAEQQQLAANAFDVLLDS